MENNDQLLTKHYRETGALLTDQQLIEAWQQQVENCIFFDHSAKDILAMHVYRQLIIDRKLMTEAELQQYYDLRETENEHRLKHQ